MTGLLAHAPVLRGTLRKNQPLAQYTAWHVGGHAQQFYQPKDLDDCIAFLSALSESERVIWLGLGSNILFPDGLLSATVISLRGALNCLSQDASG